MLALFDIDNTLFDRDEVFAQWAHFFIEKQKLPLEALELLVELDAHGFASREHVFNGLKGQFKVEGSLEGLIAEYRQENPRFIEEDGSLRHQLTQLGSDGWTLGVITNGPTSQREKLKRLGIDDLFDVIVVSDEVGVRKPQEKIFAIALEHLGGREKLQEIWMIGDEPTTDILGGVQAGFRTLWISNRRHWTQSDYSPDLVSEDRESAIAALQARNTKK
jgi:HAD superfamily hydrolase (TIGR01549 family)